MIDYTTAAAIDAVRRRASLPPIQPRFSDATIAAFLDEEMRNVLVPLILSIVQEHFVAFTDYLVTEAATTFPVPPQAIGNKLTAVTRLVPGSTQELVLAEGYLLRSNRIILSPMPGSGFTLRVYYYRRPNRLVDVSKAARVTAINTVSGVVNCASVPTAWTTGTLLDAISGQPTFEVLFEGVAIAARSGFDITLPPDRAASLAIGGYLSSEGEAVVPAQIPIEGHSLIVEGAVMKIAEALGDTTLYKTTQTSYSVLRGAFLQAIAPRVDKAPKRALSRGSNCWDYI